MEAEALTLRDPIAPPAAAAAPAVPAVAQAAPTKPADLTAIALSMYGDWRADVAGVKANLSTLALDLSTGAKCKEARSLRQRIVLDPLAAARKVAAGIKSKMADASKKVGAELEAIEAAYKEADALILPRIEAREAELEAERQAKAAAAAARAAGFRERIDKIRGYVAACEGRTSEEIAGALLRVKSITIGADFEEFADEAHKALVETIDAIAVLRDRTAAREAEAARLEQQRREAAELEARLAAMRAEEQRLKREAEERAAAERQEIERREREAEEAAARERAATQAQAAQEAPAPVEPDPAPVVPAPEPAPVVPAPEPAPFVEVLAEPHAQVSPDTPTSGVFPLARLGALVVAQTLDGSPEWLALANTAEIAARALDHTDPQMAFDLRRRVHHMAALLAKS